MTKRFIDDIQIGRRFRKALGDIDSLTKSIEEIGLLHPPVITPEGKLIAGIRRLEACKRAGWKKIPVTIVDLDAIVAGEIAENVHRKDFLLSEAVAIYKAVKPKEEKAAKKRQREHGGTAPGRKKNTSGNFPEVKGEARDTATKAVGMSGRTLEIQVRQNPGPDRRGG